MKIKYEIVWCTFFIKIKIRNRLMYIFSVNGNLVLGPRLRKKRFVVLWVVFFFSSVGRNCIKKQPKGLVFGTIFIPFCTSWVPRGIWKPTKITTSWKHANQNTNKMKNRKLFECVAILLKTGGLNGCTFTVVFMKKGCTKKVRLYINEKTGKYEKKYANFHLNSTF